MHRSYSDVMLPRGSRKEWRQRFSFRQKSLKTDQVSNTVLCLWPYTLLIYYTPILEKFVLTLKAKADVNGHMFS